MARPHGKDDVPRYITRQLDKQIARLEKTHKERELHLTKLKLLRRKLTTGEIDKLDIDNNPVE